MSEPCGQKQGAYECEHIGLPDTHAHLSYVVERAGSDFLDKLSSRYNKPNAFVLDPGVDFDDFPTRKKMLGGLPFVRLAAGIWPDSSSMSRVDERVAVLEDFVRDFACRAVGECGLDYHWMHGSVEEQAALFAAQIHLAVRYSKPLIVHSRNAHADTLSHVRNVAAKIPVVIHCFGYDADSANEYLAAGCYVSFAGNITYKKSGNLRAACATVP
ncbi:MAG: TatD family hydrolase, partial [Spirochaetales bacterium]|nr:TatD family hydrolase [Spirochaetales bacterium]